MFTFSQYENWLQRDQYNSSQFSRAMAAIRSARSNIAWGKTNAEKILDAARDGASAIIVSTFLIAAMLLLSVNA